MQPRRYDRARACGRATATNPMQHDGEKAERSGRVEEERGGAGERASERWDDAVI